jgi:(hydroxyamino)benzene mutase
VWSNDPNPTWNWNKLEFGGPHDTMTLADRDDITQREVGMKTDDRLVFWGVFLFFLSLLTGLLLVASPSFVANQRGVLAGHLEAAMNGMFLAIVGLFFHRVTLSVRQARVCRGALLYSAFANWLFTTLAGILGTSEATPIAGAGHHAAAAAEQAILVGLVTVALAMLLAVVLLLMGLRRTLTASTVRTTT